MEYQLKLNKPSSLRGSDHGKIQALTDMYDFIINTPSIDLSPNAIQREIQKRLYKLGCNNLEVKGYPNYLNSERDINA
mgnify:FL=1